MNIIQKDIIFNFTFNQSIFSFKKFLKQFEKYGISEVHKEWTIWDPFRYKGHIQINILHDIDIGKIRQKQHDIMMQRINKKEN